MKSFPKNFEDYFYPFLIFFTAVSIYIQTINVPLISDESFFIQRNQVASIKDAPSLFEKKYYDGYYYRPLPNFISGISTLIFKYNIPYYRIVNILLHSAAGVLIYIFLILLLKDNPRNKLTALFSALFFIVFPLHDYAVIWQTDLFERVMIIFYLAGLIAFLRNGSKPGFYSMLFFALSLLSKEMAFSFPLVIGLIYFYFGEKKFNLKKSFRAFLPYFGIAAAFILLRIILFNNNLFTAKDAHSTGTLLDVVKNYFIFSGLLAFPFYLREMQSFLLSHKILTAAAALIFLTAVILVFSRRRKDYPAVFFILFILMTIAPASRLLMRWYLYLPSVGFTALLSYFIFSLKSKNLKLPLITSVVILMIYSAALLRQESKWVRNSNEAVTAMKDFINSNRDEIIKNKQAEFLTIPAKIDDIPVFQLGFDKLFNFYLGGNYNIKVEVDSKSYLSSFSDSVSVTSDKNKVILKQADSNYFILFNNGKNINFAQVKNKSSDINSLTINKSEIKNKILYTFSNGKFYKIEGLE